LKLTDNQFSVLINEDSESYLTLTAEGLKISGIDGALATKANATDVYTKAESDAKYLTEHQDISNLATKSEVTSLDNKVEGYNTTLTDGVATNTSAIATLNGNALVEGSVDNKVKAAKDVLEAEIAQKANATDVYTKTEIDNKGYITEHQDISSLATKEEVNTAVDSLNAKDAELETEVNKKIESVEVEKNSANELQYIIKVDGSSVGTIDIPKDQFLKEVTYDAGNKTIVFTFETSEGAKVVNVSVADLVDTYTAGNGLKLTDNQFSVLINEDSESYLTLTAEGLKISGIDGALATKANVGDSYTKVESDAKYLTEHQDISNLATKTEVNDAVTALNTKDTEIEAKADANTAKLEILNGNESQEGSVKKALNDAKGYADSAVLVEKNRAEAAETANANAIAVINGNESQTGSIKKALADAKAYTDSEIATEKNRAEAAENVISDAVAIINGNEAQAGSIKKALKDANEYTDTLVADERTARQTSDNEINAAINNKANKSEVYTKAEIEAKGYLTNTDISNLATKDEVSAENARAMAAEATLTNGLSAANANISSNASDISALQTESARLNLIADETDSIKLIKSKDDNGTELAANVKLDGSTTNIIKITGNGLTADVEMSYSQATNTITFSNGIVTQEFQLAGASLIEDGFYDSTTRQIVLVTRLADGSTKEIRINADALIHTLKVDNGTQNPIKLYKTTDTDGVDVLSARLDISTEAHNLILNNNGTLYASNEAKNMTGLWGGEEKSLQWIVSQIEGASGSIDTIEGDVADLKNDMTTAKRDISSLQSELTTVSNKVTQNTIDIATNRGSIDTLTTQVSELNGRVTNLTNDFNDLRNTVDAYENRVSSLETDMTNVKTNVATLINDVDTLKTQLGDISGLKTVAERLTEIENIVNNLIDFDTY
jgi:outer membrane murein-binding lipoprotein Lpp